MKHINFNHNGRKMMRGVPTEQSSVANMPPIAGKAPQVDRRKVLLSDLQIAKHRLAEERKVREDLQKRTAGVQARLAELETLRPQLAQAATSFAQFAESAERGRHGDFLGEKGKIARSGAAASTATAAATQEGSEHASSTTAARKLREARQAVGASHDFPNLSTFFSYPPRDEHGFLLKQTQRSSKRSAFCTTYAGEKILGQCEDVVNRERMKRAEQVTLATEEADRRRKEENERRQRELGELEHIAAISARRPENTEKPPLLADRRERAKFRAPGASRTASLPVHMMPPAGKTPTVDFEQSKTLSSRRTLFYTDYEGKPIMIDTADRPHRHDFVLTGL